MTAGPSAQTAIELTLKETARRMPLTRERMLSSTKRAIIASVNGMEPKTSTMKMTMAAYSVQPWLNAASRKTGPWQAMMPSITLRIGKRSIRRPTASCDTEESAYTTASSIPSRAGCCTRIGKRALSSSPLPLVVKLNRMLVVTASMVITRKTLFRVAVGSSICLTACFPGAPCSTGAMFMNSRPQAIDNAPGTMKAVLQSAY